MTGTVILNVVIILGIIVAGGFLIFFMGDLLMSIFNPKKDKQTVENKKAKDTKKIQEKIEKLSPETAEEVKKQPEIANLVYGGVVVEAYNPEEEEKTETIEEVKEEVTEEVQPETTEAVAETEEESDEDEERDAYIAQRRRELMERLARMAEEEDEDEEEEESEEEVSEEEETETVDVDEEKVEEEKVAAEPDVTAEELEAARRELEEVKARNANLIAELNSAKADMVVKQGGKEVLLSEEDYIARLAEQEESLKLNEKELRACKKEYMPLRRVKRTLENDEKKLRRKEALVAKQKVVLYGVNNYSDIDEEKAKKLAEDLDLLDGLKLSVEHCQEVMNKNEDRYPLLEKMYNILTAQNEELKASIARTKEELAKVRAKKDGNDD